MILRIINHLNGLRSITYKVGLRLVGFRPIGCASADVVNASLPTER